MTTYRNEPIDLVADIELDEDTFQEILSRSKARHTPKRTEIPFEADEWGAAIKPGSAPSSGRFYGGDDTYTLAGVNDADRAVNLFLTKTILETSNPKTGRPFQHASDRLNDVMVKSAEKALQQEPTLRTDDEFVIKSYNGFRAEARTKAMTSTGSGSGDEWVPQFSAAELWRDVHLATVVAQQIRRVAMPTNPYTLPTVTADATFYYASSENTAVTGSNPTTDSATLTAKKIVSDVSFSGEFTEDSIVPAVPAIRANLVRRGAQTIDDIIVSGDTETSGSGNVNSDDQARTANSADLALDGLRKFCLVTNTGQVKNFAGAPTTTLYLNTRALLGRYGARASDLVCIIPPETETSLLDVSGFKSLHDFGPQATVLTGQIGAMFGTPVVVYEAIPGLTTGKTADDGKADSATPANNAKGWLLLTNKVAGFTTGFRRELQIESYRDIQADTNILVCSFRIALIPSGISTLHTALGRNITVL